MSGLASLALRGALLLLVAVVLQLAVVSQITLLGVTANLLPLLAVSLGLLAGATAGAVGGFAVGLLADLLLLGSLGVSSLVYLAVGYGAGRVRETLNPGNDLVPLAAGALGTALALVGYALLYFLLGVSLLPVQAIAATVLVNAVLALPVHALVRRVLAGALPDGGRPRRRAVRSVRGGLSPLTGGSAR